MANSTDRVRKYRTKSPQHSISHEDWLFLQEAKARVLIWQSQKSSVTVTASPKESYEHVTVTTPIVGPRVTVTQPCQPAVTVTDESIDRQSHHRDLLYGYGDLSIFSTNHSASS